MEFRLWFGSTTLLSNLQTPIHAYFRLWATLCAIAGAWFDVSAFLGTPRVILCAQRQVWCVTLCIPWLCARNSSISWTLSVAKICVMAFCWASERDCCLLQREEQFSWCNRSHRWHSCVYFVIAGWIFSGRLLQHANQETHHDSAGDCTGRSHLFFYRCQPPRAKSWRICVPWFTTFCGEWWPHRPHHVQQCTSHLRWWSIPD